MHKGENVQITGNSRRRKQDKRHTKQNARVGTHCSEATVRILKLGKANEI